MSCNTQLWHHVCQPLAIIAITIIGVSSPIKTQFNSSYDYLLLLSVAQNKDAAACANPNVCVELNPAYKISAGLTYTAQLVQMLAFYLDIRLPYKMLIR